MPFIYGPPVTGEDFINREKELRRLITEIDLRTQGKCEEPHIEISAPRRIGKSSLLLQTKSILSDKGYTPIYIQLLDVVTVDEFFDKLREAILSNIPVSSSVREKITQSFKHLKIDPTKLRVSMSSSGGVNVDFNDIVGLYQENWKERGKGIFSLLRKYSDLKFVLFLDEMGFVRKLKEDDSKLEFLNFLDEELGNPNTPVCILCGSQNFFLILKNIKSEIYQLWRRKFMRMPVESFDREVTIDKLLTPNLKRSKLAGHDFFTEEVIQGISQFIFFISNGYPSITQILGKETVFEFEYMIETAKDVNAESFKSVLFQLFKENIWKDKQSICNELLSEEALGERYAEYRKLIFALYNNRDLRIDSISSGEDSGEFDQMLRDLEQQQYILLDGESYVLMYPFLKYYIWHPRKDALTMEELEAEWERIFQI